MKPRDPNNNNNTESKHKPRQMELVEFKKLEDSSPFVLVLPDEMLKDEISKYFNAADFVSIGSSCRRFHTLFGEDRKLGLKLLQELLNHVVRGEQEEAEQILKSFPDLLTLKGRVVDYSGRTIEGTALQIALGAGDVRYHKYEICMVEMIEQYLKKLPNGEEEMVKQIHEQFPLGWKKIESQRAKNDLAALKKITAVIAKAKPNDNCEAALDEFRNYLKPKDIIKTGHHFNMELLMDALRLFEENIRFGGWGNHRHKLFCVNVLGYIERFLPANYAQAFCQDTDQIVNWHANLKRSLKFRHDNAVFFPLDSDPAFRLGHDYVAGGDGRGPTHNIIWRHSNTDYVMQKKSRLQEFIQRPDPKNRCALM